LGQLSVGLVILCRFPFSDLSASKLRPCLVVGLAEFDEVIACQITSKAYESEQAIALVEADFSSGSLVSNSFIRPDKLATLDIALIVRHLGVVGPRKLKACKTALASIFELD
jgi:mRNA interferase MazF